MTRYGLALWFALLSVSPAVCHEHPDGDTDHSHGYGVYSPSPLLVSPCSPESDFAPSCRHYHLVLLGIEITLLPGCAALETGILPGQSEATLNLNADAGSGLITENQPAENPVLVMLADAVLEACLAICDDSLLMTDVVSSPCDPARALRSGIQVI